MNDWYYYIEGQQTVGPLQKERYQARIRDGKLGPYQLLSRDGGKDWKPALLFEEFRDELESRKTEREPAQSWVVLKKEEDRLVVAGLGPFTTEEIRAQLSSGAVRYTDYIWKEGMFQWRRISQLKVFAPDARPRLAPQPVVDLRPPEDSAEELLRTVEVQKKEVAPIPKPIPKPPEASGVDLAKTPAAEIPEKVRKPILSTPQPPASTLKIREVPRSTPPPSVPVPPAPAPKSAVPSPPPPPPPPKPEVIAAPPSPPPDPITTTATATVLAGAKPEPAPAPKLTKKEDKQRARLRKKREAKSEPREPTTEVTSSLSKINEMRIALPANWKQIALVASGVLIAAVILFGKNGSEWMDQLFPSPVPIVEVPPPPQVPPEQVAPTRPKVPPAPPALPIATMAATPTAETPKAPAPKPHLELPRSATRLRIRAGVKDSELTSLEIETDAPPSQAVWLEVIGGPGQVADRSHYYKRWKWTSGQPLNFIDSQLPPGYYHMSAKTGTLTSDERFEIGTHTKGFQEHLRVGRKHSVYEFWSEKKDLYRLTKQLAHVLSQPHKNTAAITRLSNFHPSNYVYYDLWQELKTICKLALKQDAGPAKEQLQQLQQKISLLGVWH